MWAQADLQMQRPVNRNPASKSRAGRLLARCHTALGDHTLAVAAVDSALQETRTGALMLQEALTVRQKALLGKAAAAAGYHRDGLHWSEYTGKQQVLEMVGRMTGSKELREKLLLHGL